ncbi:hypothetical protein F0562_029248 [Nyssa sinensis]|uniref:DUF4378 domain-containing protein n=1 Tax=Nyssa sinensis TaxID=561372 RepID=A0A5J5B2I2_9ASTE|nr:hypothetical protein F0562_029248 [Nyssa sinensis]
MEVEKRGSKGGFLQLFDWNAKSRKKLFSNKSELPEGLKQGKENLDSSAMSWLQQIKVDENCPGPSSKGSNDYSCASSVSGDEGCGTKAPGVVARLMGLDSLPTSNVNESRFTLFFESHSFRDFHSQRNIGDFQSAHHIINYGNMLNKVEGISMNPVELRLKQVQSRPIERFQTEILPPKSVKTIPITHHRLLSPIKNPGFIQTKNAAYIMEAAAKIIEQSPQSTAKGKMPSLGSSSVPLRIRDLKKKIEATQKTSRLPEASQRPKDRKGQPSDRRWSGSRDTQLCKASVDSEKGSSGSLKNKGKSVSLAIQAKVNVQRREGLTSGSNRSFMNQKEDNEGKLGRIDKKQPNVQKTVQKRTSASRTCDVLRQNNQKQNCVSNKDRVSSKPSASNQKDRKSLFTNGSLRPRPTLNKVVVNSTTGTRKTNSVASDTGKDHSSKSKNLSRKRPPVSSDTHFDESVVDNDELINKNERSVKCNVSVDDGCMSWDATDRKDSMDVVSFTFTSPIKKPIPGSQLSGQVMEKNMRFYADPYNDQPDLKYLTSSPPGFNVVGGDALSALLEQKLKELTCRVESSHCNSVNTEATSSPVSSLQDSVSTLNVLNTMATGHDKSFQLGLQKDKSDGLHDFDCSSVDALLVKVKQKWQGSEEMEEQSSSSNKYVKELHCQYHSPTSSLEPSFSDSSDSKTSFSSNGSKNFLSAETEEMFYRISDKKPQMVEGETELSDSASSITATTGFIDLKRSSNWELEYVRDVLGNAELMFEDFALGQAHNVINPDLFDLLENQKTGSDKNMEEFSKLEQKMLFDCVSEYLELSCGRLFHGSCNSWAKWSTLFQKKGWLAEELCKEISGLTSMGDLMVDELVDKDMSTQYGKWVGFEIEAFEEGVEIQKEILTSLVDEMVTDLLLF